MPLLVHYLFRIICFEFRICSPEYFLDEMQKYEVNTIIANIPYLDKVQKETDRYKLYVTVQSNSKKRLKVQEIMSLPWDNETQDVQWTDEYKEEMKKERKETEQRIAQIIKNMNNKP